MRALPGKPTPLGATWDGKGVNFAIFSEHATRVELCVFSRPEDGMEAARIPLPGRTGDVWHAYLPDARPGLLYGYRVDGPFAPTEGHRFNPRKLLIDPYAKALSHAFVPTEPMYGYPIGHPRGDIALDSRDSAADMAKCVVVDDAFSWGDDRPPRVPWEETVVYECHVKGMTVRHPEVPAGDRGRYLGLSSEPIIAHLLALGVTAVELLPIHQCVPERRLVDRGLTNYWGYNSIAFLAPDVRFASGGLGRQVAEFKTMVKRLHAAGLEVILDVVYNHTAEGNEMGPTLSFRGIDNTAYYRLDPADRRRHVDFTACGNTVNVPHPRALALLRDSLRYWVEEMHVDGFRFDLAPALAREPIEPSRRARFFAMIDEDPVISRVKLIAEPWDAAPGGYLLGAFPKGWSEWNAKYRDAVRRFWRGESGFVPEMAFRLGGSTDLFGAGDGGGRGEGGGSGGGRGERADGAGAGATAGRGPTASVNYVACHDGATLHDLVTYERKYNEANGEDNRDGPGDDYGWNWGVEGPSDHATVVALRERAKRNLLASLAFSQGVPMIGHGDEMGRTQRGNNNAYCQDNEVSWVDWTLGPRERELLEFARRVFAMRREHPALRRRSFFRGGSAAANGPRDLTWLREDGAEMAREDWANGARRVIGMLMRPDGAGEVSAPAGRPRADVLLLFLNGGDRPASVRFPAAMPPADWREIVNTARAEARHASEPGEARHAGEPGLTLEPHSLVLLSHGGAP
jgi:isoamylase